MLKSDENLQLSPFRARARARFAKKQSTPNLLFNSFPLSHFKKFRNRARARSRARARKGR